MPSTNIGQSLSHFRLTPPRQRCVRCDRSHGACTSDRPHRSRSCSSVASSLSDRRSARHRAARRSRARCGCERTALALAASDRRDGQRRERRRLQHALRAGARARRGVLRQRDRSARDRAWMRSRRPSIRWRRRIESGARAGLRVHAWINVNFVASAATLPRSRDHVVFRHPEWLMVPSALAAALRHVDPHIAGVRRGARALDARGCRRDRGPLRVAGRPRTRSDYTTRVVARNRDAVRGRRHPPRLPALSDGRLRLQPRDARRVSRAARRGRAGGRRGSGSTRARPNDPAVWTTFLPEGWTTFRRDRLTTLATRLRASRARRAAAGDRVGRRRQERRRSARRTGFRTGATGASRETFDALCPMIYTDGRAGVRRAAREREHRRAGPRRSGPASARTSCQSPATADRLRVASAGAGAAGFVLFSYDNSRAPAGRPSDYFAALRQCRARAAGRRRSSRASRCPATRRFPPTSRA